MKEEKSLSQLREEYAREEVRLDWWFRVYAWLSIGVMIGLAMMFIWAFIVD